MQVGSSIEFNKNLSASAAKTAPSGISTHSLLKSQKRDVFFGQETQPSQENKEPKKNPWSVKNVTNWTGILLYPLVLGIPIAIKMKRNRINKDTDALEKIIKQASYKVEDIAQDALIKTGQTKKGGLLYKISTFFNKAKDTGEELTNCLVYGFGTVVVMPLVILFSPIGKKNTSKEDKTFAVLRQPLSFVTMFSVQATFDALFKKIIPQLNSLKLLEGIKGKNDKELLFNESESKNIFKTEFDKAKESLKAKNLLNEVDKELVDIDKFLEKALEKYKTDPIEEIMKPIQKYITENSNLKNAFEQAIYTPSRAKVLKEVSVITTNVIVSQFIGCTLLNVIYGKTMKKWGPKSENKTEIKPEVKQETAVKGGK
ncbi:MAG: hypothetical protein PHC34_13360 [Candidatus Gastranaerophilales bacterium]|nr:hypothetical protein [Candidatus Gastranaerophilales bacterium]